MSYNIYQIDFYSITILYEKDEISINIIDSERNIYELVIDEKHLHNICIFNLIFKTTLDYYKFIITSFENIEKYKIIILNKNYKFIRLTIKEYFSETISNIINILWIKNKKNLNNSNEYVTINFEEKYIYEKTSLISDNYNIIKNDPENNENFISRICLFIYKLFNHTK